MEKADEKNEVTKVKHNNRMKYIIIFAILIIVIVYAINNPNPLTEYENQASSLSKKYNLNDATLVTEYIREMEGYSFYQFNIISDDYENFSDQDKYDFMSAFNSIRVRKSKLIMMKSVVTKENTYTFKEYNLEKNNKIYVKGKRSTPSKAPTSNNQTSTSRTPSSNNTSFAYVAAKNEVRSRLKSPSSAKFPASSNGQDITEVATNTFVVRSYVESENSFGAMLKIDYMVKIEKLSEESYRVLDIQIYE